MIVLGGLCGGQPICCSDIVIVDIIAVDIVCTAFLNIIVVGIVVIIKVSSSYTVVEWFLWRLPFSKVNYFCVLLLLLL